MQRVVSDRHRRCVAAVVAILWLALAACSGSDAPAPVGDAGFTARVLDAVDAVEAELGGPQEYFEVTATPQLVNVFVALDGATTVEPYVYLAGELQPPAPQQTGVSGQTFTREAIDFDPTRILTGIETELPEITIDALSIEGGPGGFVRYVVSARSSQGGVLDVVVTPSGAIVEVNPL